MSQPPLLAVSLTYVEIDEMSVAVGAALDSEFTDTVDADPAALRSALAKLDAARPPSRRPSKLCASVAAVALMVAGSVVVGTGAFSPAPPSASAASPFDDEIARAALASAASIGWDCSRKSPRLATCQRLDEAMRIEAFEGVDATHYVATATGQHPRRTVLFVYRTEGEAARQIAEARTHAAMHPHIREGARWSLYGTDPNTLDVVARALPPN